MAYVDTGTSILVLLVTTRRRGRWTIPKGWRKPEMEDAELAAREAREEGGVEGEIGTAPVGSFVYTKRLHVFSWVRCRVAVYPLLRGPSAPELARKSEPGGPLGAARESRRAR